MLIKALLAEMLNKDNYSTSEKRIGKWVDGKPLYRVCIQFSMTAVSQSVDCSSVVPSNANIVQTDVRVCRPAGYNNNSAIGTYYELNTDKLSWYWATPANRNLVVRCGSNWPIRPMPLVIIIEYTKLGG